MASQFYLDILIQEILHARHWRRVPKPASKQALNALKL